jgi:predicted dehydrogenase
VGSLVKWGIVSTADINRKVIPGAHASAKVDLVAVASRDRARAEAYAREWEIPRAYGSYEDLLADPEIEAVYISLPNTLHAEWSARNRSRAIPRRWLRHSTPPSGTVDC